MSLKICLAGATGGVGRQLARAILTAPDLTLHSAVARRAAGQDIGTAIGEKPAGILIQADIEAALDAKPDVLVDYTHPSAIKRHVLAAVARKIPVVVGTSGMNAADHDEIEHAAMKSGVGVATGNFALTVP